MQERSLEEANRALAAEGYPPIQRLPADDAAIVSWKRLVDAKRELDRDGKLSQATLAAVSQFCHCYKCPSYPRGDLAVYCLRGKTKLHVVPITCKCPTCEVYQVAGLHGTDYFCMTGAPGKKLLATGGAVEAAKRFLETEIGKGNPGKRLPERLMAPPQLAGRTQDDVETPEKVPGT